MIPQCSHKKAKNLIWHGTHKWKVRRALNGMSEAAAISRNGFDILNLLCGTNRNEKCVYEFVDYLNFLESVAKQAKKVVKSYGL